MNGRSNQIACHKRLHTVRRFGTPRDWPTGDTGLAVAVAHHRSVAVVERLKVMLDGIPGARWRMRHRDVALV